MELQGPHEAGGAPRGVVAPPPSRGQGVGPLALILSPVFFIFSENFLFCTINNTMEFLLKTASVRVSFIQIMQIRVQNKRKSVRKSRYIGYVSTHPRLNLCLSSSNSVDKLKVIKKKLLQTLFALVVNM